MTRTHGPRWARCTLAVTAAFGLALSSSTPASAAGMVTRSQAVASSHGETESDAAFDVKTARGLVLNGLNHATAKAKADDSRAVSLSFQVAVVSPGRVVRADNKARSEACDEGCEALAMAHQFVLATDQPMSLSSSGKSRLRQVEAELRDLSGSNKPLSTIESQVWALTGEVQDVLNSELKVQERKGKGGGRVEVFRSKHQLGSKHHRD